jgi:hypothetical protein
VFSYCFSISLNTGIRREREEREGEEKRKKERKK